MDPNLFQDLPQDILNIIAYDMSEIMTLFSKKHRDYYFRIHGILINMNKYHRPTSTLLYTYDTTIIFSDVSLVDMRWLHSIKHAKIKYIRAIKARNIDYILGYFNNVEYISGSVTLYGCDSLEHVKNNVSVIIKHMDDIEKYSFLGLSNRIWMDYNMHPNLNTHRLYSNNPVHGVERLNLYDKIEKASDTTLLADKEYPILHKIKIIDINNFLKKHIIAPNVRKLHISNYSSAYSLILLQEKYPQAKIHITHLCFSNWDNEEYNKCKDLYLCISLHNSTDYSKLYWFEKNLVTTTPSIRFTKTIKFCNDTLSSPGPADELFIVKS